MGKTHLVIGDAHADPKVSNRRFDWLGNFINEHRPDVIIDIGDWGDFASLCSYDKGKHAAWGNSYERDCQTYRDASKRAFGNLKYKPKIIRCGGNHEEGRIIRVVNDHPELKGTIDLKDLGVNDYGAQYVPFGKVKIVDGIAYSHYFYDKDQRYPILTASNVLRRKFHSSIWGHTHIRDMAEGVRSDGRRIIALNVGCYLDPNQFMTYAGYQGNNRWWNGLVLLKNVNQGAFDPAFFSIKEIQENYS